MSFVDQILGKLFPEERENNVANVPPIHSETLKRTDAFQNDFRIWKIGNRKGTLLKQLQETHQNHLLGKEGPVEMQWHQAQASAGLYFTPMALSKEKDLFFLLDLFRDRLLEEGYMLYTSDRKFKERSGEIETTERHCLKPPLHKRIQSQEQQYGTVLLELLLRGDRPQFLKIMAQTHSGPQYAKAIGFDQLIGKLFLPD